MLKLFKYSLLFFLLNSASLCAQSVIECETIQILLEDIHSYRTGFIEKAELTEKKLLLKAEEKEEQILIILNTTKMPEFSGLTITHYQNFGGQIYLTGYGKKILIKKKKENPIVFVKYCTFKKK